MRAFGLLAALCITCACAKEERTTVPPGALYGRVLLGGESDRSRISIVATGPSSASTLTNPFGEYLIDGLAPGSYAVTVSARSTREGSVVLQAAVAAGQATLVPEVSLSPLGGVAGRVDLVDAPEGTALAGSMAALAGTDHAALTDDEGKFTLDGIPTGPQVLVAVRAGFGSETLHVVVPYAGHAPATVALRALPSNAPTGSLAGTALLRGLEKHAGIVITATGPVSVTALTDAAGAAEFRGVPNGVYLVTAAAASTLEHVATQLVRVANDTAGGRPNRSAPPPPHELCCITKGCPPPACCTLVTCSSCPAPLDGGTSCEPDGGTGGGGDGGTDAGSGGEELPESFAFEFSPAGTVTGLVAITSREPMPAAGALVTATEVGSFAVAAADGSFRLELPIGTHTLRASLEGFAPAAFDPVEVLHGRSTAATPEPAFLSPKAGENRFQGRGVIVGSPPERELTLAKACQAVGQISNHDCGSAAGDSALFESGYFEIQGLFDGLYSLYLEADPYRELLPYVLAVPNGTGLIVDATLAQLSTTPIELQHGYRVLSSPALTGPVLSPWPIGPESGGPVAAFLAGSSCATPGKIPLACRGTLHLLLPASAPGDWAAFPVGESALVPFGDDGYQGVAFAPGNRAVLFLTRFDEAALLGDLVVISPLGPTVLATRAPPDFAPRFSADGTRLLFRTASADVPGQYDLWLADLDPVGHGTDPGAAVARLAAGVDEYRLTASGAHAIYRTTALDLVSVSTADGATATLGAAVARYELSSDQVVVATLSDAVPSTLSTVRLDGTGRTPLATGVASLEVVATPDGEVLLYRRQDPATFKADLGFVSFATGTLAPRTLASGAAFIDAVPSPAKDAVAFRADDDAGGSALWLAPLSAAGTPLRLTAEGKAPLDFKFTGPGTLGFREGAALSDATGALKMASAGGTAEIAAADVSSWIASADGSRVVYAVQPQSGDALKAAAPDGSAPADLAGATDAFDVSPDGALVAYRTPGGAIHAILSTGGAAAMVAPDGTAAAHWQFLPGPRLLTVASDGSREGDLFLAAPASEGIVTTRLATGVALIPVPHVSPDASAAVFTRGDGTAAIALLSTGQVVALGLTTSWSFSPAGDALLFGGGLVRGRVLRSWVPLSVVRFDGAAPTALLSNAVTGSWVAMPLGPPLVVGVRQSGPLRFQDGLYVTSPLAAPGPAR